MINFALFHEEEEVWLYAKRAFSWPELRAALKRSGLRYYDDRFTLERKGVVPVWQSRTVVFASFFLEDQEVYDFERAGVAWDGLRLGYLLASLPPNFVANFVEVVFRAAAELETEVYFGGRAIEEPELRIALEKAVKEVEENLGVPGN